MQMKYLVHFWIDHPDPEMQKITRKILLILIHDLLLMRT